MTIKQEYNLLDVVTLKHLHGYYILLSKYGVTNYFALRIDTHNIHHNTPILISKNIIKEVIQYDN